MVWRPQFQIEGLSKMEVKEVFEKKSWTTELRHKDRYVTDSITFDITLGCPMSFTRFPFDQQICNLEVVSAVSKMKLENQKVDIKDTSTKVQDFHIQVQGNTQRCIEDFCSPPIKLDVFSSNQVQPLERKETSSGIEKTRRPVVGITLTMTRTSGKYLFLYFVPAGQSIYLLNIARGTTDPEIDSMTWTKFGNNMAPLA